jgi:hypothetical protein
MPDNKEKVLAQIETFRSNINKSRQFLFTSIFNEGYFIDLNQKIDEFYKGNIHNKNPYEFLNAEAVRIFGVNPITNNDYFIELEKRIEALDSIGQIKKRELSQKLRELTGGYLKKADHAKVWSVLFELFMLGKFAQDEKLKDIEVDVNLKKIDGKVVITDRVILVEIALVYARIRNNPQGPVDPEKFFKQVERKIREKSSQLSGVKGPTLVVVGRRDHFFDVQPIKFNIAETLKGKKGDTIGGLILTGSFPFPITHFFCNSGAKFPLGIEETEYFKSISFHNHLIC